MSIFKLKLNQNLKNIWRYAAFYPPVAEKFQLTADEGWTPEIEILKITKMAEVESLIFKREDQNPGGSHKDRGLAYQISRSYEEGRKNLIISSSGNAAISASRYCKQAGINLFVLVSSNIEKPKLAGISENGAKIIVCSKPVSFAEYAASKFKIKNIKATSDKNSYYGCKSIGFEIFEHIGEIDSIFLPASSAATLLGIAAAYKDLLDLGETRTLPQFHIAQSSKVHPLAAHFDHDFKFERESLAKAIVARKVPKEKEIIGIISKSGGSGWVVENDKIKSASRVLAENDIITSYEGAMALAAIFKARDKGINTGKKAVCLLTGKAYNVIIKESFASEKFSHVANINNIKELEEFIAGNIKF